MWCACVPMVCDMTLEEQDTLQAPLHLWNKVRWRLPFLYWHDARLFFKRSSNEPRAFEGQVLIVNLDRKNFRYSSPRLFERYASSLCL